VRRFGVHWAGDRFFRSLPELLMREIVVLGCGFAGYHAAQKLEKSLAGRRRVRLTVVSRRAHFTSSPLLPAVATGQLEPDQVITPISDAFGARTRVIIDEIHSIDLETRHLVGSGEPIPFDYLLIATGGVRRSDAFEGADALRGPDDLGDAVTIGDDLRQAFSSASPPRRFAVIGASSTGVEWAAELAAALSDDVTRQGGQEPTVDLFEAGDRILPDHSHRISLRAAQHLEQLGIVTHLNSPVESATTSSLTPVGGSTLEFDMVYHCAGRRGLSIWDDSSLPTDDLHRICITDRLEVEGTTGIFAAGDAATGLPDSPATSNPQVAVQQGRWACRNLLAHMTGRTKKPFQFDDRGDFVTLGRGQALLDLRGIVLEGKAAWLAYRLYYTSLMPRPIQKARLLVDSIARRLGSDSAPPMALPDDGTTKK
jgi:NADH:ubiquinone reductase (H+-translocating)